MKRIIIVEDDIDFAEILKEELEDDNQVKVVAILHSEQEARDYFAIKGWPILIARWLTSFCRGFPVRAAPIQWSG